MNNYDNQLKLEMLFQEAQTYALLEPIRNTQAKYLRRALKAAKYALRTAWAVLTTTLEPKGAL
ncbi:MAG: hypothetical protein RLZZ156_731 [Deinococcota bacterium]|jgi:hypothetical protein